MAEVENENECVCRESVQMKNGVFATHSLTMSFTRTRSLPASGEARCFISIVLSISSLIETKIDRRQREEGKKGYLNSMARRIRADVCHDSRRNPEKRSSSMCITMCSLGGIRWGGTRTRVQSIQCHKSSRREFNDWIKSPSLFSVLPKYDQ